MCYFNFEAQSSMSVSTGGSPRAYATHRIASGETARERDALLNGGIATTTRGFEGAGTGSRDANRPNVLDADFPEQPRYVPGTRTYVPSTKSDSSM